MYTGQFGPYTRWAVVFLIIFVLFFLLCPGHFWADGGPAPTTMVTYPTEPHYVAPEPQPHMPPTGPMMIHGYGYGYGYESPSSP